MPDLQAAFAEDRFGADIARLQEYKRLGMSALMLRYETDASAATTVKVIVDALTDQIVERWEQNRLGPAATGVVEDWDHIEPAFGTAATLRSAAPTRAGRAVHVAVAAATEDEMRGARRGALYYYPGEGRDWIPYAEAAYTSTTQLALEAAVSLGLPCRWLDAKNQLVKAIRALESRDNEPVLVLVDPWSLEVKAIERSLSEFDQQRFRNAMVIVACNPHENAGQGFVAAADRWATIEKKLRAVFGRSFPMTGESAEFIANIRDIDALRAAVARALRAMRGIAAMDQPVQRKVESSDAVPMVQN
jgi:FxsC-like protein